MSADRRIDKPFRSRIDTPQDTGWLTPTYASGWADWSDTSNELVRYRRVGTEVFIRGLCRRTSGTSQTILTMPAGFRPTRTAWRVGVVNGGSIGAYTVSAAGNLDVQPAVVTGQYQAFDIQYDTAQP